MNIGICVATYKRPAGLATMLDSFARMELPDLNITVFIAENDPAGLEGYNFLTANKDKYPFDIFFEVEPRAGISYARNTTLAMVRDSNRSFDYIAFTDDDTAASSRWILDMVDASKNYHADVVFGKVEPRFSILPSKEILEAPYFLKESGMGGTGMHMTNGGTNNVLLSASIFKQHGWEVFDIKLALSGSEDKDFFMSLEQSHYTMIYCASAVVYEIFPASRLNEDWLLNRYYRRGSTQAYLLKKRRPAMVFYRATLKKLLKFPSQYLKYRLRPSLGQKCYVYDSLGFFNFLLSQKPAEEYSRTSAPVSSAVKQGKAIE